jgi:hypothetical protein
MARPKIDPRIRYAQEIKIWKVAEITQSANYDCGTKNAAIAKMHRLHMARAALREELGVGAHLWDIYVVRINGSVVSIVPKELLDMSGFRDKDGNPIAADKVEKMLEEDERPLTDAELKKMLETDKDTPNAEKLHFDPTKPLDLE